MRSLMWIILLALACLCVYNLWEAHTLKADVRRLTEALASDGGLESVPPRLPEIEKLIGQARAHLDKAQEYVARGDPDDSRLHIKLAAEKLEKAKKLAEEEPGDDAGLLGDIKGALAHIKDTVAGKQPAQDKDKGKG
jgi:hypothetical protein